MNREKLALLEIIRIGITGECLFTNILLDANWRELIKLALMQGVSGLVMNGLEVMHKTEVDICPTEQKLTLYAISQQTEKNSHKKWEQCTDFAERIKPVTIVALKGIDYAQFWPEPYWREFCDLDCYAINDNSDILNKLATTAGCQISDGGYKHTHLFYKNLMIENHHSFISYGGAKESVLLEKELENLFDGNFTLIKGTTLLSPNRDFTAVFMIAHAQNHFFYEGISLRMILDWHFFLRHEGNNVDWKRIITILERTKLKRFTILLTYFCKKYFGLPDFDFLLGTENEKHFSENILNKFTNDIFSDKYNDTDRRLHKMAERMLHRYYRMWKFRSLMRMPIYKAVWRSIAYSSFLHRKPKL